ncbi:MAG: hypothetical protein Q7T51_03475 [Candidatus Moranbacteria bacterium]|nr:hypothetical protein [Candidatus Moranbacteria bacterium]
MQKKVLNAVIFSAVVLSASVGFFILINIKGPQDPNINHKQEQTEHVQERPEDIFVRNVDISRWTTYKNEEQGIEFKYPEKLFDLKIDGDDHSGSMELVNINNSRIWLTQKGFSVNDTEHRIIININSLKTIKEYYVEKDGKCNSVSVSNIKGKICGYESGSKYEEDIFKDSMNRYLSLINDGVCNGQFTVFTNEIRIKNAGDFTSSINVGCNDDFVMEKIYQAIYKSIHFSK